MKRALPLLLCLIACTALSQTTDGRGSGLNRGQLAKLRATKLRCLVPAKPPSGYKVVRFELETNKDPMLVHMSITYKKGTSRIIIQQSSEGLGDLFFDEDSDKGKPKGTKKWSSPIFKNPWGIEYQTEKGSLHWHIQWHELPGKRYPRYMSAIGYGGDVATAKRFLASVRWLK